MTSDQVRLCPGDAALPSLSSYRIPPPRSQPPPPRHLLMRLKSRKFGYAARRLRAVLLAFSALCVVAAPALAQDAPWLAAPGSGNFNTAANWTPATVPAGTASFGLSSTTGLSFSANTAIGGWAFKPGAPRYHFNHG